jgi:ABC-type Fe3+-siderophore transport system permease subunit
VKGALHRPLWATIAPVALLSLLYQNSGWVQFGYRFSLDYTVFLILLLALGGRPLGWRARALILAGIAVNAFGAITFGRMGQFYYDPGERFFPTE